MTRRHDECGQAHEGVEDFEEEVHAPEARGSGPDLEHYPESEPCAREDCGRDGEQRRVTHGTPPALSWSCGGAAASTGAEPEEIDARVPFRFDGVAERAKTRVKAHKLQLAFGRHLIGWLAE